MDWYCIWLPPVLIGMLGTWVKTLAKEVRKLT